jgi:hypothetical protein
MKKWLIGCLILLFVFFGLISIFIPGKISINSQASVKFARSALERTLFNDDNWKKWWPHNTENDAKDSLGSGLIFNSYQYKIQGKKTSSILFDINKNNTVIHSSLNLFYDNNNTAILEWNGLLYTSNNPVKKLQDYFEAKRIEKDLKSILNELKTFFAKTENIYGSLIEEKLVEDSVLIFTDTISDGYPSTEFIYSMIGNLKKNMLANSVKETGYPMLNVTTDDSIHYLVKVAIPVDKEMPATDHIAYKKMMKAGNILVTEVKGGPYIINNAFKQMDTYVTDHERIPPAIPFLSLVTNRVQEPDTSKWITRIYYPVR